MRVLLCDTKTGMFYRAPKEWTSQPEQAQDFGNSLKAFYFAHEHSLSDVEVHLDFGDPEYNVSLPVQARLGKTPSTSAAS